MDINLRQLRMLREVAARGTMAAAAESLGFTPSAISQQLGALERSTGVDVLERVGRNVRLTDAGRELVHHADNLLNELERARVALERVGTEARGVINLSIFESVAATLLPLMLTDISEHWPHLDLRTKQAEPFDAYASLRLGDLDAAFDLMYPHAPSPTPAGLVHTPMFRDWFRLVVPDDDALAGTVGLEEASGRAWVASPPELSCGRCVTSACHNAGFEPDVHHQVDDYPTVLQLVASRAGVALIPELGLISTPPGVRIVELEEPVSRTVGLAYRHSSSDRPAIQALLMTVRKAAEGLGLEVIAPT